MLRARQICRGSPTFAVGAVAVAAFFGSIVASSSVSIPSSLVVSHDGDVTVTLLGGGAQYRNDVYLELASGQQMLLTPDVAASGSINLGHFRAGTELSFCVHVNDTGDTFYSGGASLNADQLEHAVISAGPDAGMARVQFEDMFGGGDRDFDDVQFLVGNVNNVSVPEAGSTMFLLALSAMGLATLGRLGAATRRQWR